MTYLGPQHLAHRLMAHARKFETVTLRCETCGTERTVRASHKLTDSELASTLFKGWEVRGVQGAKSSQCPQCKSSK